MARFRTCMDSCMAASVGLHFICCGLPALLALIGTAGAFIKVPHNVMGIILIISGVLLAISVIMECFACGCHRRWWRIGLIGFCIVLYAIGVCGHFGVFSSHSTDDGNAVVFQCH